MDRFRRHPPETRQAAEAMLRDTDLPMARIAARMGLPPATVKHWNAVARLRARPHAGRLDRDMRNWSVPRLRAAARLFARTDIAAADIAEAMGARRRDAPALALACAREAGRHAPDGDRAQGLGEERAPDRGALETALRAQIAHQIATFDTRLREGGAAIDSARVLRDLGGLKRLLDDLAGGRGPRRDRDGGRQGGRQDRHGHSDGDADGECPEEAAKRPSGDLAALRADIARRYDAFEAARADRAVPGEPAGGSSRSAGD